MLGMNRYSLNSRYTHWYKDAGWIRIGPLLVQLVRSSAHAPLFSERYGYRRFVYVGDWKFRVAWHKREIIPGNFVRTFNA